MSNCYHKEVMNKDKFINKKILPELMKEDIFEIFPSCSTPENYSDAVKVYNIYLHKFASKILKENFLEINEENSRYSIITTGSDGRYEKSPLSKIELILIHEGNSKIKEIEKKLNQYKEKENKLNKIFEVSENKDLRKDSVLIYQNYEDRVFPTRALDSILLAGNKNILRKYKDKMIDELRDNSNGKKKILKFDNHRRYHKKLLETGISSKNEIHFDENKGKIFYDGNRIKSTKFTHLRAIQYKIASDIFKEIRRENINYEILEEFPLRTIDRLNYLILNNNSKLSNQQINEVILGYKKSLFWYHLSEEMYSKNNSQEISLDIGEFKEINKILRDFSNIEGSIFKN